MPGDLLVFFNFSTLGEAGFGKKKDTIFNVTYGVY